MDPFVVLSDPLRRRVVEDLARGPRTAGELTARAREVFAVSQPAVSNQLRVLRDAGFVRVTRQGSRRIYELDRAPLAEIDRWMARQRRFWNDRLDALDDSLDSHD